MTAPQCRLFELLDQAREHGFARAVAAHGKLPATPIGIDLVRREVIACLREMAGAGQLRDVDVFDPRDLDDLRVTAEVPRFSDQILVAFDVLDTPMAQHLPQPADPVVVHTDVGDAGAPPGRQAILHVLADDELVVQRHPALRGHVIAYIVDHPSTAQIGPTARIAWDRLDGEHGPIVPVDKASSVMLADTGVGRMVQALFMAADADPKPKKPRSR